MEGLRVTIEDGQVEGDQVSAVADGFPGEGRKLPRAAAGIARLAGSESPARYAPESCCFPIVLNGQCYLT